MHRGQQVPRSFQSGQPAHLSPISEISRDDPALSPRADSPILLLHDTLIQMLVGCWSSCSHLLIDKTAPYRRQQISREGREVHDDRFGILETPSWYLGSPNSHPRG